MRWSIAGRIAKTDGRAPPSRAGARRTYPTGIPLAEATQAESRKIDERLARTTEPPRELRPEPPGLRDPADLRDQIPGSPESGPARSRASGMRAWTP
ncbi:MULTISPECIES: hypothetical protein [Streptomyces]|uniref:hypothetical protein n=1 Tax=Streptomyces TaxID=1883 RepID=UPI0028843A0D|nr:hypothetical protein [Streptomyces sp. DSM 41859]MDT0425172.1 hypothetical protein [Streptomyces sp. DSM 41859]